MTDKEEVDAIQEITKKLVDLLNKQKGNSFTISTTSTILLLWNIWKSGPNKPLEVFAQYIQECLIGLGEVASEKESDDEQSYYE